MDSYAYKAAMDRSAESVMQGSKSGMLYKQGHKVRNWKRRWFSLCDKRLYYFHPSHTGVCFVQNIGVKKESRPYGVVLLEGYTVELVNDARIMKKLKRDVDQLTLFRLWHPVKPAYLLCADTEEEMEEWISAILMEQFRHYANRLTVVQDKSRGRWSHYQVASGSERGSNGSHRRSLSVYRLSPRDNGSSAAQHLPAPPLPPRTSGSSSSIQGDGAGSSISSPIFEKSRRDKLPLRAPPPAPDGSSIRSAPATPATAAPPPVPTRTSPHASSNGQSSAIITNEPVGAPPLPSRQNQHPYPSPTATAAPPPTYGFARQNAPAEAPPVPRRPPTPTPQPTSAPAYPSPRLSPFSNASPAPLGTQIATQPAPPIPITSRATSPSHHDPPAPVIMRPTSVKAPTLTPIRPAPAIPPAAQPPTSSSTPAPTPTPTPMPTASAPPPALPKRVSPVEPILVQNANVRLSAFGGPDSAFANKKKPNNVQRTSPQAATLKRSQALDTTAPKSTTVTSSAVSPTSAAPTTTPRTPKDDQREQMRQAVQLQAAREKEMRQRVMQKMNEKQQAKRAAMENSESQTKGPAVPPEVKTLFEQLDKIEHALDHASDTQILKGKGAELNDSLKALKDPVVRARQQYPQNVGNLVERYNELSKKVPARVNEVFSVQNRALAQNQPPPIKAMNANCSKCGAKLAGDVMEVAGMHFHRACFGCSNCGRKLEGTCLNIGGKPYCDGCGKQAFIRHTLARQ